MTSVWKTGVFSVKLLEMIEGKFRTNSILDTGDDDSLFTTMKAI